MSSRLEQAISVFLDWRDSDAPVAPEALLAAHGDLEDYLRPIVFADEPQAEAFADEEAHAPEIAVSDGENNETFGDYRLVRELGRGGMGVVHEAHQVSLGRSVALKVLTPLLTHDPSSLVRFRREASTAARLQHPGIAQIMEFGRSGEHFFLAMQLVRGASLEAILKDLRDRPLSEASGASVLRSIERNAASGSAKTATRTEAESTDTVISWADDYVTTVVRIVIQVADTLDYAHGEGVIHRDVKPSNLLVQPNGRAVLVDFGLAREEGPSSLTLTGDFAGSPYYVSPEQASRESSQLDRRSDVFSLGITLYEALTLQRPFEGANPHEVIGRILAAEPAPPNKWNSSLPSDLSAVVLKAIEKPLHRRYQTAGEFAQDLRAFLELRPVTARYPTPLSRLGRWMRREPIKVVLVIAVLVAIGLLGYLWSSRAERIAGEQALFVKKVDETLARGWFACLNRDVAPASERFLEVLALDPGNTRAMFGYLYASRPATKERRAFLGRHVVEGRDEDVVATLRRDKPTSVSAPPAESAGEATLHRGNALRTFIRAMERLPRWGSEGSRERFAEGLHLLESAIYRSDKPRFEHYMQLGFIASQMGDRRRATLCADALLTHWPDFAPTYVAAGVALRFTESERAIEHFHRAIAMEPELYSAHFNLALAFGGQRKWQEALASARTAIRIRPDEPGAQSVVSMYLVRLWEADRNDKKRRQELIGEAITLARRSVELDSENANFMLQLAVSLERGGKDDEATRWCRRALELRPYYNRAHRNLIGMARKMNDLVAERKEWERWVRVNPNGPTAHRELADFLLARGSGKDDMAEALRLARRANQLLNGNAMILLTLAEALQKNGITEGVDDLVQRAAAMQIEDRRMRSIVAARIRALRGR